VAAAADGVSRPSQQHHYQADDEEEDPDDQANMGVGEGRDEGREEEPEDDKEDSEADHDIYLVSVWMFGGGLPGSVIERVIYLGPPPVWRCPRLIVASFGARAAHPASLARLFTQSVAGQVVDKPTCTGWVNAELVVRRIPG